MFRRTIPIYTKPYRAFPTHAIRNRLVFQQRSISTARLFNNVKLVSSEVFSRSGGTFLKRVAILISAYMVLNAMFNAMLMGLSVNYISKIQTIPSSFKFWDKYSFFQSIISDDVLMKGKEAHVEYGELLKRIAEEKGSDSLLLDEIVLVASPRDFVSGYCDLVIRYALSSPDRQELEQFLSYTFKVISKFGSDVATPKLKNQGLRTLAALQTDPHMAKAYYEEAVDLLASDQWTTTTDQDHFSIVPPDTKLSREMLESLLDLLYFHIDQRLDMPKALAICVSILRSLEYERDLKTSELRRNRNSNVRKELETIETELCPMIKSNISEILWYNNDQGSAIKWAQDAALESSVNAHENLNSARICKNSFKNLSKMYEILGDSKRSKLCLQRSENMNLLIPTNVGKAIKMRDVVLDHYFGNWGKILFP